MEIGEKIRKLRTDAGMTQDELAARLLVTRTAVSKWETGKGWPGVDSLKLIADEFGVSIDSLVSDEDVQSKRTTEDKQSLRLYFAAIACAVAAILAAAIGMGGVFDLPPMAATVCRWIAVWGMIGYVMLSFAFSRASERMGKRRVLASRVVVVLVVLVVMMGFVGVAGSMG
ncbi:MAG: helix-turn-helix transcriptional regulator [Eggerthellaceae bacterium]|nr:helix-turn-helix transcriptional regulator [Eggerthellaceae bacterium]